MTKTDSQNVYCRKRENEIVFERVTFWEEKKWWWWSESLFMREWILKFNLKERNRDGDLWEIFGAFTLQENHHDHILISNCHNDNWRVVLKADRETCCQGMTPVVISS